jgi:NAD(P)-dependent dehydrogenase (short-subunit alcohol dehydrogenase family)
VLFAREGAKVLAAVIASMRPFETKRMIEAKGGICEAVAGNVARADDGAGIVGACIATFGRVDVLHNNVGIVEVGGPVETTEESWGRGQRRNLKSMFLTCKHVLPHMERQGKGAIVKSLPSPASAGLQFPTSPMQRPRPQSFSSSEWSRSNTPGRAYG